MSIDFENLEVVNNTDENRFEIDLDGRIAKLEYNITGKNILYTHTEVPEEFEGKSIGSKLARTALDYAREEGLRVQPVCPFVKSYVSRHKEYHDITFGF